MKKKFKIKGRAIAFIDWANIYAQQKKCLIQKNE